MEQESLKQALPGLKEKRARQKREILSFFYKQGKLSKPEICRLTSMTAPTINRIIGELVDTGWVIDCGYGHSAGGKRPHLFSLNPNAAYVLGVDVGRIHLKIAVFNLNKEMVGDIRVYPSILETASRSENLAYLSERVKETIAALNVPGDRVKVAGIAVPGLIDKDGNSYSYLLNGNENGYSNLKQDMEQLLGIPVFVDNDSNVMAIAEHTFGVAKDEDHALCICVNECIGLGMILNGKPYSGAQGMAGEFGHIRLRGLDAPCYCGKIGCLESVASGRAIVAAAREAVARGERTTIGTPDKLDEITLGHVIRAANRDDLVAIELLQRVGERLGEGITTLIHLFNPRLLVIGGELADAGDHIVAPVLQTIGKYTLGRLRNRCEVKLSNLKTNTTIMGTLMLVMQDLYYDDRCDFFQLTMQFTE